MSIDGFHFWKKKQMSAILEIYFRFRFRPFVRNLDIILHQATEFRPNRSTHIWRYSHFWRWRPRRLNTTSGFVSVDVTAFRRSLVWLVWLLWWSISKPNFVEISQMEAEIYFLWQSEMAWEGVKFFFKIKNVSISYDALLHFMNTKMYFWCL